MTYKTDRGFDSAIRKAEKVVAAKKKHRGLSMQTKAPSKEYGKGFFTYWCKTCDKDTAHRGSACIMCGTSVIEPEQVIISRRISMDRRMYNIRITGTKRHWAQMYQQAAKDRKEHFRQQAEISRRKFEGDGK